MKRTESRRGLLREITGLKTSVAKLKKLVLKDYQTGLYNRRFLQDAVEKELSYARRHSQPFSVIMMDIDYFKAINDAYGHQFGDIVLKHFAKAVKNMVRRHDVVVRFGGEEFIIVTPRTNRATGVALAERILHFVNHHNFGNKKNVITLKSSLAVASYPEDGVIIDGMDLIYIADKILRKVKELGGNKVYSNDIISESGGEPETDIKILKGKVQRLTKRANQCVIEAVFAFAKTMGLKDRYTAHHAEVAVEYAEAIARKLGLSEAQTELVRKAAVLHDLGKAGIDEEVLRKKAKLSRDEYAAVRRHPRMGADIIKPVKFLNDIIPLMLHHHERWDGKGYPAGLKGEEIPIGARIIAVIDVYQSLTSNRPYRKAYSKEEAMRIIEKGAGSEFDPAVVTAFLKVLIRQ